MSVEAYEVGQRSDKRGVDLISDALRFGRVSYREPTAVSNAVDYATFRSRSYDAVIRVYDEAGKSSRLMFSMIANCSPWFCGSTLEIQARCHRANSHMGRFQERCIPIILQLPFILNSYRVLVNFARRVMCCSNRAKVVCSR
jgi:hypothetical protein